MNDNELLYLVKGICMKVHRILGCGLLENAYRLALVHLLRKENLLVKTETPIAIKIDEESIHNAFRADIIVNDRLIIELKAVDELNQVHHLQIASYMQLANIPLGLIVNFRSPNLQKGMYTSSLLDLKIRYKSHT